MDLDATLEETIARRMRQRREELGWTKEELIGRMTPQLGYDRAQELTDHLESLADEDS